MDERGRNKGSENGAAEKEYQMGTRRTDGGLCLLSGSRGILASEEEDETAPSKKVLLLQFWPSMTDGGGDNMCQSSLFDLENESTGRSRCIWRVQKEATQRQTGRESRQGSDNMPNSHLSAR